MYITGAQAIATGNLGKKPILLFLLSVTFLADSLFFSLLPLCAGAYVFPSSQCMRADSPHVFWSHVLSADMLDIPCFLVFTVFAVHACCKHHDIVRQTMDSLRDSLAECFKLVGPAGAIQNTRFQTRMHLQRTGKGNIWERRAGNVQTDKRRLRCPHRKIAIVAISNRSKLARFEIAERSAKSQPNHLYICWKVAQKSQLKSQRFQIAGGLALKSLAIWASKSPDLLSKYFNNNSRICSPGNVNW